MTREDIIRMAREAGIGPVYGYESIEHFFQAAYAAGAAAEREACAKVCDEQGKGRKALEHYAALTYSGAAHDCAAAIRARGQA